MASAAIASKRLTEQEAPDPAPHGAPRRAASDGAGKENQDRRNGTLQRWTRRTEAFAPDRRAEPDLLVELAQHGLDRRQLRLHLDDKYERGIRVPAKEIDRSALAVARIRHLGNCRPAAPLEE